MFKQVLIPEKTTVLQFLAKFCITKQFVTSPQPLSDSNWVIWLDSWHVPLRYNTLGRLTSVSPYNSWLTWIWFSLKVASQVTSKHHPFTNELF